MDFTPEDEIKTLEATIQELKRDLEKAEERADEYYKALEDIYSTAKSQL